MFFNNNKNNDGVNDLVKIAALLIHAASIDENYTEQEENIIKQTLIEIGANKENLEKILNDAKVMEKNASQILDFTKKVKNMNHKSKIMIIESLWKIIYSNNDADMYETNLMRRLAGLLYIDSKTMGDIKDKIKNENF